MGPNRYALACNAYAYASIRDEADDLPTRRHALTAGVSLRARLAGGNVGDGSANQWGVGVNVGHHAHTSTGEAAAALYGPTELASQRGVRTDRPFVLSLEPLMTTHQPARARTAHGHS